MYKNGGVNGFAGAIAPTFGGTPRPVGRGNAPAMRPPAALPRGVGKPSPSPLRGPSPPRARRCAAPH